MNNQIDYEEIEEKIANDDDISDFLLPSNNGRPKRIIKQTDRYSNYVLNNSKNKNSSDLSYISSTDDDIELSESDSDWSDDSRVVEESDYEDNQPNNKSKNKNKNNKDNDSSSSSSDEIDHVSETDLEETPTKKKKKLSLTSSKKIKSNSSNKNNNTKQKENKVNSKNKDNSKLVQTTIDTSDWTSKPLKSSGSFDITKEDRNFSTPTKTGPTFTTNSKSRLAAIKTTQPLKSSQQYDFFQQFMFKPKSKDIDLLDDVEAPVDTSSTTTLSSSQSSIKSTSPNQRKIIQVEYDGGSKNDSQDTDVDIEENEEEEEVEELNYEKKKDNKQIKEKEMSEEKVNIEEEDNVVTDGEAENEEKGGVEEDDPPIVNMKRYHRTRPLFPSLPSTPTKRNSIAHQTVTVDLNEILNGDDEESTEEEEILPSINRIFKRQSSKSSASIDIDGDDVPTDDDVPTEDEDDKPTQAKSFIQKAIQVKDDDEEEEEEEDSLMKGYEIDDGEDVSQLDKLIKACELFSKRMLEILSSLEDKSSKGTNNSATESNKSQRKIIKQPNIINRTMRPYQLIGLNWMGILYQENISGILADEMGLGKTVQSISLLGHIYEKYKDTGPHLIIVPATTYSNWKRELEMWCPTLKIYSYYGTAKEREMMRYELRKMKAGVDFNVIITTYNILFAQIDRAFLKRYTYSYQILDEAQNIKNSDSKRYKNLYKITAKHRLLLTGTPLQNNIQELWSLLNFIMPHIFGKIKNNTMLEELLSHSDGNSAIISRMKKILSPFFLRRLKSEVSLELKPKEEFINHCTFAETQAKYYAQQIALSKKQLEDRLALKEEAKKTRKRKSGLMVDDEDELIDLDDENGGSGRGRKKKQKELTTSQMMTNLLMQLRKIANHPLLCQKFFYTESQLEKIKLTLRKNDDEYNGYTKADMDEIFQDYSDYDIHCIAKNQADHLLDEYIIPDPFFVECSAKCLKLNEILAKEIKKGNKVLVFSMMTKVLDLLEEVLAMQDITFCRLDGSTPVNDRQPIIDLFSNDKTIPVMLLSTLAGGLGINLIAANVVIFYDISFNPQVERQAEDRAHRLGQEKVVYVHRLIVDESVDKNILEMSTTKKELNDSMLEEGSYAADNNSKLESKKIVKLLTSILA